MEMDETFITDLEASLAGLQEKFSGRKIRLKRGAPKAQFLLLLSAMENARGFIHLLRTPYSFASISNARSALEALIDFFVLARNPSHFESMQQTFLRQKKSTLASSIRATKSLLPDQSESIKVFERDLSQTHEQLIAERKQAKKAKSDLIAEYLDESGLVSSIWAVVCDVTHNNINSLAIRHISVDGEGVETLRMNSAVDSNLAEVLCATLAALFRDASPIMREVQI